jgi:replicative DNA helicase
MIAAHGRGVARAAEDAEAVLAESEKMMVELRTGTEAGRKDPVVHCRNAVMEALDHIEKVYHSRGRTVGLPTGIHDWDRMTGGLMGGDMITLAGRPSHGKTALGMEVALNVAMNAKVPTLVFSVEMPGLQLMVRALCGKAKVDLQRVRDGFLGKQDLPNLMREGEEMSRSPLYIDDSAGLTSAQLRARARAAKVRHGIGLIVIDYLQFMRGSGKRAKESRQLEVSEISATIKAVAKELNIPVIALAQLNRDAEDYGKPKLSHLRDSGSIEQDSDQVLLIHRLDKKKGKKDEEEPELDHNVLLLLEKQRNGPTGEIKLWFEKEFTTFRNLTEKTYSNRDEERQR